MINILYSILTSGFVLPSESPYLKRRCSVYLSERATKIKQILMRDVPLASVPLFASVLCFDALHSNYGREIASIDTNNTYAPVVRHEDSTSESLCLYAYTQSKNSLSELLRYLDSDIMTSLGAYTWSDIMSAGCLQLLREI